MHYSLLLSENRFHQEVTGLILECGMTPGIPKILEYVAANPGCNQNQIARGCAINKASTAGILKRMIQHGLIEKEVDPASKRSYLVYLSDLGQTQLIQVQEIFKQVERTALREVTDAELETCIKVLHKIYWNLENGGIRNE